jgi:hypothetical protein
MSSFTGEATLGLVNRVGIFSYTLPWTLSNILSGKCGNEFDAQDSSARWRAWKRLFRTGCADFEVHSRLTMVFCLLTCARNRAGFYIMASFWRRNLSTHLLFCHVGNEFTTSRITLRVPGASGPARRFQDGRWKSW